MLRSSTNSSLTKPMWIGLSLALALSLPIAATAANAKAPVKGGSRTARPAAPVRKPAEPATKPGDKKPVETTAAPKPELKVEPVLDNLVDVTPDELVTKPHEFVNKNVKFNGDFSSFSSLALDYKPAMRSSKTHLSFLIFRKDSHVPLSELKLAMMIPKEKDPDNTLLATLKEGDKLELVGKVFSAALDDPWVEVFKVKKLNASTDDKKASADVDKDKTDKAADAGKGADAAKPETKSSTDTPRSDAKRPLKPDVHMIDGKPGIKAVPSKRLPGKHDEVMPIPTDVDEGKKPKVLEKNVPPVQPNTEKPPTNAK